MRILIVSDTHGDNSKFQKVLSLAGTIDSIIHAGDYLYHGPRNPMPDGYAPEQLAELIRSKGSILYGVLGNCDSEVDLMLMGLNELPRKLDKTISDTRILVHHGDQVLTQDSGMYDLVVSGHTHIAGIKRKGKTVLVNPGSPALPKDSSPGTFAIWNTSPSGTVDIYDLNGRILESISL